MIAVVVGVLVVAAVLIGVVVWSRNRPGPDGVASFRRQIDALSPEARRPTIQRMRPTDDDPTDEDGSHGT